MEFLKGMGRLFYVINPAETYVKNVEDVPDPDYVNQAIPFFITLIVMEYLIQWYRNKPVARINDGITSLALGMYLGCGMILFRGIESYVYIRVYEHYRIYELPWDSPWTWWFTAIGVDFCYYWVHRAAHELNFFWGLHQVHHSSEDYNLTTALRQSMLQNWVGWVFYIPLAFFVPPSIAIIHSQFNLLFQFWIHTEAIESLGPLEWVLNTPRHHRIHHGSNRYCLDKNYAGALIIWDRMFGTFVEEKRGEKIIYGLVEDVNSMNPFWLQFFYFPKSWRRMKEVSSLSDKLGVLLNGPGWAPGKPRLGDPLEVPEIPSRTVYDPKIPHWQSAYAVIHFFVVLAGFDFLVKNELAFNQLSVILCVGYVIYSLTSIGLVLENRRLGITSEICRCLVTLVAIHFTRSSQSLPGKGAMLLFAVSVAVWITQLALELFKVSASKPMKTKGKKQ